jgi:GntR family transcriptional regulator
VVLPAALPEPARRLPDGPEPLWRRLQDDLRARIASRELVPAFPGELAIAAEYGVSRHTVREALRSLRQEGLVVAGKGRTPRVAADGVLHQPLGVLYSLFRSVESTGLRQASLVRVLETVTDPPVARRLGRGPRTSLLHLARVRFAGDDPLALDEVWLPTVATRPLLSVDFTHTALYDELRSRCGIVLSGGTEEVRACLTDQDQARELGIPHPSAVLRVERVGCVGREPFEFRRTLLRGDRFALSAEFAAGEAQRLSGRAESIG